MTRPSGFTSRLHMPTPVGWGVIVGLVILAAGLVLLMRGTPVLKLEPRILSSTTKQSLPVNALGIGVQDFALLGAGDELVLARLIGDENRAVWQHNFEGSTGFGTVRDVNGDGLDEICVATADSAGAWAFVLSRDNEILARLGPMRDSTGGPEGHSRCTVCPVAVLEDSAGHVGIVCGVTAMAHRPRGIALYDFPTGRRRWFFPMGAWPESYATADLLGDGRRGLAVGTSSTDNGLDINGTDDSHAVVLALDAQGRRLWQTTLAKGFARVGLLPVERHPGYPARVIAAVHSHLAQNPEPCVLALVCGRTGGVLKRREFAFSLGIPRMLDSDRGVFVLGCGDGTVRAFDTELQQLAQYRAPSEVEVWACADLTGDGRKYVIASTRRDILILDDRLRLQLRYRRAAPAPTPFPLAVASAGVGRSRLLRPIGEAVVYDVRLLPPLLDPWRLLPVLVVALLGGVFVYAHGRMLRRRLRPTIRQSRDFLVDYRQVRHDIFEEARPFGALWNWAHEAMTDAPLPRDAFEDAREQFVQIGRGTLERFVTRARELHVSPERIGSMRSRSQDLDALLAEPIGGTAGELANRARRVAEAMRAMSDACGAAYREVAEREPCQANRVLGAAMMANQARMGDRGVAVHVNVESGASVPVLFDSGELREIIAQLILNAMAALEGVPDAELRIRLGLDPTDGRRMVLSVEDNGPGIATELREQVFQPGYSSRAGGGFGLPRAREVARSWHGDLVVEDPPHGRGAALRLTLSVLFPFEARGARPTAGPDAGAADARSTRSS